MALLLRIVVVALLPTLGCATPIDSEHPGVETGALSETIDGADRESETIDGTDREIGDVIVLDPSRRPATGAGTTPTEVRSDPERHLAWLLGATGYGRVIVQLDVPFVPEGDLDPAERRSQRDSIQAAQTRVIETLGREAHNVKRFTITPALAMTVTPEGYRLLSTIRRVRRVVPDLPTPHSLLSSVPMIGADIMHGGWNIDGSGRLIALIDSGIDRDHPAFSGRIVQEACFSDEEELAYWGPAALCPNGNDQQIGAGSAETCSVSNCDHGTLAAGVAASDMSSHRGVAPGAGLFVVQTAALFNDSDLLGDDFCEQSDLGTSCVLSLSDNDIEGLEHICERVQAGLAVDVVNINHQTEAVTGSCDDSVYAPVIDTLVSLGVTVVAPAGNFDSKTGVGEPACVSSAIAVGGVADAGWVPSWSQTGPELDLFAPAVDITTTDTGGWLDTVNGTSFSGPHVAGAVALLRQVVPEATAADIRAALTYAGPEANLATDAGITRPILNVPLSSHRLHRFPTVGIVTPADGMLVPEGATLTFKVTAGGEGVSDDDVVWAVDGVPFATGDNFEYTVDSPLFYVGNHELTATVVDDHGLVTSDIHELRIYGSL